MITNQIYYVELLLLLMLQDFNAVSVIVEKGSCNTSKNDHLLSGW